MLLETMHEDVLVCISVALIVVSFVTFSGSNVTACAGQNTGSAYFDTSQVLSFTDVLGSTTSEAESLDIGLILGMAKIQVRWASEQQDRPTFDVGLLTYKTGIPYTDRKSPSSGGHSCCCAQSPCSSYSARTRRYKDEPTKSTYHRTALHKAWLGIRCHILETPSTVTYQCHGPKYWLDWLCKRARW